jgi:Pyruvate/2-oxoacid:ferredoxin oxidoreductase delta subunit
MITIECPLCAGEASTDEALTVVRCEGCGISAQVAPDPVVALEAVA